VRQRKMINLINGFLFIIFSLIFYAIGYWSNLQPLIIQTVSLGFLLAGCGFMIFGVFKEKRK